MRWDNCITMANEFDPFTESRYFDQLLTTEAIPIVKSMVAGLGGVEKVFHKDNRNLYIQEYMAMVTMLQAVERLVEPPGTIYGISRPCHASIAFRNGTKLPILAAKGSLRAQTFMVMAELGGEFLEPETIQLTHGELKETTDLTGRVLGYAEAGYHMLNGAYEPLVDLWEDELSTLSGYGVHVRQGIGFVAALASETNERYLRLLTEAVLEEAFPDNA